jgi:pyruvate formate lyase activating enzyme
MSRGRILHLQRLSTEDGPGIRTTVFFKGCSLRCAWCHNPESLIPQTQLEWHQERCLDCRTCVASCPYGYLEMSAAGLRIDRQHCPGCGLCAEACPANALEALGKEVSAEEVLKELLKDRAFYEKSGGGVTLSGGEPSLQPDFAEALLRDLKDQGISTALDTCGLCSQRALERLLPHTDLVLYDLKLLDPDRHRQLTGQPNQQILENLLFVQDYIQGQSRPIDLWIRTPLIPGATDAVENLQAIGSFIARHINGSVSRWELCAFNNLCRDKYRRLEMEWAYAQTPLLALEELERCEQTARASGVSPEIVVASRATRTMVSC